MKRATLIYDGECRFCIAGEKRLRRFVGWRLKSVPYQQAGALGLHPELSPEKVRTRMYLVVGDQLFGGAEAVAQSFALRPLGKIALIYYVAPLRRVLDKLYAWIASHRYQIFGRVVGGCQSGVCEINHKDTQGTEKS
jgi:predicted DCC family thiol-disulfide oxidoreductase YuxK